MSVNKMDREEPPTPPNSPPCHQDRLFQDLAKFSRNKHATQLMPKAGEFNLGQGDPLMAAAVEHWKVQASEEGGHREPSPIEDLEIEDKGSSRRHRRHTRTKQRSMPNMSHFQTLAREEEVHEVDHLIEHGCTFAGMGLNDVVHLKDGTVLSVPCVSPEIFHQVESNSKKKSRQQQRNHQRRHSMPHLFGPKKSDKQQKDSQEGDPHVEHHGFRVSKLAEIGKHIGHGTLLPLH